MGGLVRLFVRDEGIGCVYRRTFFKVGPLGDREWKTILEQISFHSTLSPSSMMGRRAKFGHGRGDGHSSD